MRDPIPMPLRDASLLLRAHAEHQWLCDQVVPVLERVERDDGLTEEERCVALTQLDDAWSGALQRATRTDRAATLLVLDPMAAGLLAPEARRYHRGLRVLRADISVRMAARVHEPQPSSG